MSGPSAFLTSFPGTGVQFPYSAKVFSNDAPWATADSSYLISSLKYALPTAFTMAQCSMDVSTCKVLSGSETCDSKVCTVDDKLYCCPNQ